MDCKRLHEILVTIELVDVVKSEGAQLRSRYVLMTKAKEVVAYMMRTSYLPL